jgi:hypothetical protein
MADERPVPVCPECGTPADSPPGTDLAWAGLERWLGPMAVLCVLAVLGVQSCRTLWSCSNNWSGGAIGNSWLVGGGLTVADLEALSSGELRGRPITDSIRHYGGSDMPQTGPLMFSVAGPGEGEVIVYENLGWPVAWWRASEATAFDDLKMRHGPHVPEYCVGNRADGWSIGEGYVSAYRYDLRGGATARWTSIHASALAVVGTLMISIGWVRRVVLRRLSDRASTAPSAWCAWVRWGSVAAMAVSAVTCLVWKSSETTLMADDTTLVLPPIEIPGLTAAEVARLADSPDGEAWAARAILSALPCDTDRDSVLVGPFVQMPPSVFSHRSCGWPVSIFHEDRWDPQRDGVAAPADASTHWRVWFEWYIGWMGCDIKIPSPVGVARRWTLSIDGIALVSLAAWAAWRLARCLERCLGARRIARRRASGLCARCAYPLPEPSTGSSLVGGTRDLLARPRSRAVG